MIKQLHNLIGCVLTFRNFHKFVVNRIFLKWLGRNPPEGILWNGIKLYFDERAIETSRSITQDIWYERVYQFPEGFENFKTIVDIGANIGAFSLFAAKAIPAAKVYSIEPQSVAFSLLVANIRRNKMTEKISALRMAVASKSESRDLYHSSISSTRCSFIPNTFLQTCHGIAESVKASRLKDLFCEFKIAKCDFLKIDCEGAEFEIFDTLESETLNRISNLSMECHSGITGRHTSWIIDKLQKNGFSVDVHDLDKTNGLYLVNAKHSKR